VAVERVHSLAPPPNGARSALRVAERRCRRSSSPLIRQPSQTTGVPVTSVRTWDGVVPSVVVTALGPSQPTTRGTDERAGLKDWVSDPARSLRPWGCPHAPVQVIPGRSSRLGRSGESRDRAPHPRCRTGSPPTPVRGGLVGFPPVSHGPSRYRRCWAAERVTSRPATMECALVWPGQAFMGRRVSCARQRCSGRCGNARRGVRPRSTQGLE
jgi:hypothetical protein